jgi:hypothetical protein
MIDEGSQGRSQPPAGEDVDTVPPAVHEGAGADSFTPLTVNEWM